MSACRSSFTRRVLVSALACAASGACVPAVADAHAQLESTSPARGGLVVRAPKLVSFSFGEPVGGTAGAVRVYDTRGDRVDDGRAFHPGGHGQTIGVGLRPGLPRGTYTATYRVVSADTHVVTGGFVFSIGTRAAAPGATVGQLLAGQRTGGVTSTALTVARAVQYAAIATGVGLVAFLLAVWLGVLRALADGTTPWRLASERFAKRVRLGVLGAACAGVLSAVVGIVLQGAEASGVTFWRALRPAIWEPVLSTRFGAVWSGAIVAWLIVASSAAVMLRRPAARGVALRLSALGADGAALAADRDRRPLALLVVPLLALIALPALAGHAGVQHPVWLFLPANVVHVAAMSVWLGGLVALIAALPAATRELPERDRTGALSAVLWRFSPFALGAVAALLITGVVQTLLETNAWSQLPDTAFGRAVLIKIGLLVALIGLGAINRRRTLPRLRALTARGETPGATGLVLRRTLRAEVALLAVVLVVTGALAGYSPAKDASTGPAAVTTTLGPAQLSLDVDPARVGANEIHIYLLDPKSGAQYVATKQLTLTATLASKGIGPLELDAERAGPGHYVVPSAVLGAPGTWSIHLTDRVSDFTEYERTVRVHIR